ncbi:hypothetical protein SK128_006822 [Halocaridina rubra]|uniref:Uncharacterized protein n=1 Tax=Halocaridina rubra TaxID=373956 RepID=A0AAN8WR56_HALRR
MKSLHMLLTYRCAAVKSIIHAFLLSEFLNRMQNENYEGIREQLAKDMTTFDKRLGDVETKLKQQDDRMENRIKTANAEEKEANSIMGDRLDDKIDKINFSQERLKKRVDSLEDKVQDTPKGVTDLKEQLDETEAKLTKKIDEERKERIDDVKKINADIDKITGKAEANVSQVPSLARLNKDVDETQTGLQKLGKALHAVKQRLDTKVKEESKARKDENEGLDTSVQKLNKKYEELNDRVKNVSKSTAS